MHLPDGFLSPHTYLPAYGLAAALWWVAVRRLKSRLDAEVLPWLAAMTALAFVLMQVSLPLPGGSSVHLTGVGLLAVAFGPWTTYLALTLVLALQALLFGAGGLTSLPVNALALGLAGAAAAWGVWRLLGRVHAPTALVLAGWVSVVLPALVLAVLLGLQPLIAHDADGRPLYFPFDLAITLPAMLIPHALIGLAEGLVTWLGMTLLTRLRERHAV